MEFLIVLGVIVLLVVIVGIYLWTTYNSLVTLNVRVDEAWSDITVQLKRRADLLPNIIEAVKGYAAHEKGVFEAVTKARAETLNAQGPVDAASRRFYNGGVRELNTKIKVFPNTLFARNLGFTERDFFEVADAASIAEPPRVQF